MPRLPSLSHLSAHACHGCVTPFDGRAVPKGCHGGHELPADSRRAGYRQAPVRHAAKPSIQGMPIHQGWRSECIVARYAVVFVVGVVCSR